MEYVHKNVETIAIPPSPPPPSKKKKKGKRSNYIPNFQCRESGGANIH
jgi:hypothetical protein